jgi:hypothetical protein
MALSAKFYKTVKIVILTLLAQSVLYLGIWLYLGLITIPYLSPIAVYIGDCLSPLTPLFDPTMAYVNLKQWLHPASKAYRKTMKRRQYIALRFSWVWDKILGLKVADGMCVGPCWKLWTELALLVIVCFVVAMGWELDGGLLWRFMDRAVEKLQQRDAERAAKERLAAGGDMEKAAEDILPVGGDVEKA